MQISNCAQWYYEPVFSQLPKEDFDVVILDREIAEDEFEYLVRFIRAYTLFMTENALIKAGFATLQLIARKKGKLISTEELKTLLKEELPDYFRGSYGEKYEPCNISVAQGFKGNAAWRGFEGIDLAGDFGNELTQIIFWRNNIPIERNQTLEFWLEYAKDSTVEISLEITMIQFGYGTDPELKMIRTFSEKDLEDIVYVENTSEKNGYIFVSLKARGNGSLTVAALHDRHSRRGKGTFIAGGKRRVTSEREEIFYYFDPGNLRPPLNVYFSGYKTREGFEGYNIMRKMGHPFLLVAEARLEGGAFYMGSEEYEDTVEQIIWKHIEELKFQSSEVILSGLSMGTFGALYYGCRIHPHTILIGKPLASIGDVAANERIHRPGGFPTSLDLLHKVCGSLSQEAVNRLNDKFWSAFDQADWSRTRFAVAYMAEDDYDGTAYEKLQSHLKSAGAKIYGKGLRGRHNDNTPGIVGWFLNQYHKIIQDHFDGMYSEMDGQRQ